MTATAPEIAMAPPPDMVELAATRFRNTFPLAETWRADERETMRRISSYYWHYPFVFGDYTVEADWPQGRGLRGRHYQRYMHMAPSLLTSLGGTLDGLSVLDLGCNCGFWSIQMRQLGAEHVLGLDGSADNIAQANLIVDLTGLDRLAFRVGDVTDASDLPGERFDVVLFLGLLYHLADPMRVLQRVASITGKIAVVETTVVDDPDAYLKVQLDYGHEQNFRNPLSLTPSHGAVPLMLRSAGFSEVVEVPFGAGQLPGDFRTGRRVTFFALP